MLITFLFFICKNGGGLNILATDFLPLIRTSKSSENI
jgi:hypothetical protein